MLQFKPALPDDGIILCLGAHSDDIEIGCAGLLMTLLERNPNLRFHWVVFSGDDVRERETRAAAAQLLAGANLTITTHMFRDSYFPQSSADIKNAFEDLRKRVTPDLILTHTLADRHQDHRVLSELTWNTFRNHAVLEYEIPKYDGDLAHPNLFCPVSAELVQKKVQTLLGCFASQRDHQWFDADLFRGHMRLRGVECNSPSRFAEAFHARKLVF